MKGLRFFRNFCVLSIARKSMIKCEWRFYECVSWMAKRGPVVKMKNSVVFDGLFNML